MQLMDFHKMNTPVQTHLFMETKKYTISRTPSLLSSPSPH